MTSPHEEGHEFVYRLTAYRGDGSPAESAYYFSPHKVATWRDMLRAAGYTAVAARVPAGDFIELSDAELGALAEKEREEACRNSD